MVVSYPDSFWSFYLHNIVAQCSIHVSNMQEVTVEQHDAVDCDPDARHNQVPGTVHLVDLEHTLRAKHASGRQQDIVLVPSPSQDPDDPLNWSPRRKLLSTVTLSVYTAVIAMGTSVTYAIIVPMSKATELSVNDLNTGTGYLFLLGGWGSLIWQPLASQYGKKPVYLLSLLATMAVMVWAPYTKTNGQWIANKIIQGFFSAPVNSLTEISVADVYFTHE